MYYIVDIIIRHDLTVFIYIVRIQEYRIINISY